MDSMIPYIPSIYPKQPVFFFIPSKICDLCQAPGRSCLRALLGSAKAVTAGVDSIYGCCRSQEHAFGGDMMNHKLMARHFHGLKCFHPNFWRIRGGLRLPGVKPRQKPEATRVRSDSGFFCGIKKGEDWEWCHFSGRKHVDRNFPQKLKPPGTEQILSINVFVLLHL